ncbi:unnamed protein product [Moneuplotes crassus]|uniref:Uncharacterized protein n=1 Tax=Euplotes crassus TaxID=5936 RepID=A0AAD1U3E6_EUPCR|nr:unnamed protein product [Moneuplotes crassus]
MDSFIDACIAKLQIKQFRVNKEKARILQRNRTFLPISKIPCRTRNILNHNNATQPCVFRITRVSKKMQLNKQKSTRNLFSSL